MRVKQTTRRNELGYGTLSQITNGSLLESYHHSGNTVGARETRMNTKLPNIDFPYFGGGEGPREWLCEA